MENTDFSFHRDRADAEIEAACRCTEAEETKLHLRLALFHLERRDGRFEHAHATKAPSAGPAIYHTDKEA